MKYQKMSGDGLSMNLLGKLGRLVVVPCATLLVGLLGQPALAQTAVKAAATVSPAVSVHLTQHKITKGVDGKEAVSDAATVKPGDVLEYRATYTNHSAKAVTDLVGDLPIPEGFEYQPNTAKPGAPLVKAATKEKVFAALPLTRKVGAVKENVPYSDYRVLRWNLGQLAANGETSISARVRVQTYVAPVGGVPASGPALAQAPPASGVRVPGATKP